MAGCDESKQLLNESTKQTLQ